MRTRALILRACVGLLGYCAASFAQAHSEESLVEETKPSNLATTLVAKKLLTTAEFRLRFENNSSFGSESAWNRGTVRGRLGARYQLSDKIKLGARVVTGDPNNPRSSDATIGDFARDLDISLDRVFAEYRRGKIMLVGGKFEKPFASTELVWDGDVNPQGCAGRFSFIDNERLLAEFTGIYFAIDEATSTNSKMLGGQLSLAVRAPRDWNLALDLAYYDYDIAEIEKGLPGGARGNNMLADGVTYLSDFNLLDGKWTIEYFGLGENWPLQFVGNYVVNRGAAVSEDSAFGFDFFAGHLKQPGRLKFGYGYSQTATDAVLGLFSHDNVRLATNFKLHTFAVGYALDNNAYLGLTHHVFRQADDSVTSPRIEDDWASRTRLKLSFAF